MEYHRFDGFGESGQVPTWLQVVTMIRPLDLVHPATHPDIRLDCSQSVRLHLGSRFAESNSLGRQMRHAVGVDVSTFKATFCQEIIRMYTQPIPAFVTQWFPLFE